MLTIARLGGHLPKQWRSWLARAQTAECHDRSCNYRAGWNARTAQEMAINQRDEYSPADHTERVGVDRVDGELDRDRRELDLVAGPVLVEDPALAIARLDIHAPLSLRDHHVLAQRSEAPVVGETCRRGRPPRSRPTAPRRSRSGSRSRGGPRCRPRSHRKRRTRPGRSPGRPRAECGTRTSGGHHDGCARPRNAVGQQACDPADQAAVRDRSAGHRDDLTADVLVPELGCVGVRHVLGVGCSLACGIDHGHKLPPPVCGTTHPARTRRRP